VLWPNIFESFLDTT